MYKQFTEVMEGAWGWRKVAYGIGALLLVYLIAVVISIPFFLLTFFVLT